MIVVKIQGGLGNQLFQWAYYKKLSISENTEVYINIEFYKNQRGVTHREFGLCKFPNIKYNQYDLNLGKNYKLIKDNFIHQKINFLTNNNYYLDGFWQTEKYFSDVRDKILHELNPSDKKKKELYNIIPLKNNSISIHVRRTDYLNSNGYHPVLPINYYDSAIKLIGEYDEIIVFSDDIEWCKKNIKYKNIRFMEGNSEVDDLWLMSICKNNVIANSSFSWWSSWLNINENKKVIFPKKWFGDFVSLPTDDIYYHKSITI
jgi:hypothetical protein